MSINRLFIRLSDAQEAMSLGERAFNQVVRPHLRIITIGPQTKLVYVSELEEVAAKLYRGELGVPTPEVQSQPGLPINATHETSIEALRDRAQDRLKQAA